MNLRIDNNDGAGELDYTPAVRTDAPLTIMRERGAWTVCEAGLDLTGSGFPLPQNRALVRVLDASGSVLFEGFLETAASADAELVGAAGADDRIRVRAVEAAWLTQAAPSNELQPVTALEHTLAFSDGVLKRDAMRPLLEDMAQDVTVSGEMEAAEYVTELFRGDGTTQSFTLQHTPFRESGEGTLVDDAFDGSALNGVTWSRTDTGGYLALGAGGLRMNGGTGFDGATVLAMKTPVEVGGSLIAEADGVQLAPGSDGVLLGFYDGTVAKAQCLAGVRVLGVAGAQSLVAVVSGVEQTTSYDVAAGHIYTLRVRVHCAEIQRIRGRYGVLADGVLQQFGGEAVFAPAQVVIEVVDTGVASNTLPTVLYDGAIAVSPLQGVFAPVNSVQMSGSVGRVTLKQTGSCVVVTTASDGTKRTRRQGSVGTGADYSLTSATVAFAPGLVPQPGDLITVQYRRGRRAVSRRTDGTAEFVKASVGLPGVPLWSGRVVSPAARSSADCDAAAKALLALADGVATGVSGSVTWVRGAALADDVHPGDTLRLNSVEGTEVLPVQTVKMTDGNTCPEQVTYYATFRQGRAESMNFRVETGMAKDIPGEIPAASDAVLPANLAEFQVTVATGSALQVDSGVDASDGCGFEVRRSDANFGSASTDDLVLRSPVRSFSIPRAAFAERFFVRMYDSSLPALYSAMSSVVLTSLPLR